MDIHRSHQLHSPVILLLENDPLDLCSYWTENWVSIHLTVSWFMLL